MTDHALVVESLEICAEQAGDISDAVYARFFESCPDALPLMGHSDEHMRGRMLEQVYYLLMSDEDPSDGNYLRWEVKNHLQAYGVGVEMYETFFLALKAVVQSHLNGQWTAAHEAAWAAHIDSLLAAIHREAPALA